MKHKIKKIHGRIVAQIDRHQVKIRFLVVGLWNTIFGYLVFYFLESVLSYYIGIGPRSYMFAILLSNAVGVVMAYSLHRNITFRSKSSGRHLVKEFGRFVLGNLFMVLLSVGMLPICVEFFGLSPKVAGAVVTFICTAVSYCAHSRLTFVDADRV